MGMEVSACPVRRVYGAVYTSTRALLPDRPLAPVLARCHLALVLVSILSSSCLGHDMPADSARLSHVQYRLFARTFSNPSYILVPSWWHAFCSVPIYLEFQSLDSALARTWTSTLDTPLA